jgi:hypothetical protein
MGIKRTRNANMSFSFDHLEYLNTDWVPPGNSINDILKQSFNSNS